MRLRAVAWDVDGTLVDSEGLHHRSLLAGSSLWGVDLSDLGDEQFRGVHMADVWAALRGRMPRDLDEAAWLQAITEHYIANRSALRPLPGAVEAVEALAALHVPQACVSNSHRYIVEANLDALGVLGRMAFTIAFEDVSAGKPDPEPYRMATRWFGLDPVEVLAVEDSRSGTLSALGAGLPVALCEPIADAWLGDVTEIASVLEVLRWFGPEAA